MKKTGKCAWFDGAGGYHEKDMVCESVGKRYDGRTIWKEVGDAYSSYIFKDGLFFEYDPDSTYDDLGPLYGTYLDEDGQRVQ